MHLYAMQACVLFALGFLLHPRPFQPSCSTVDGKRKHKTLCYGGSTCCNCNRHKPYLHLVYSVYFFGVHQRTCTAEPTSSKAHNLYLRVCIIMYLFIHTYTYTYTYKVTPTSMHPGASVVFAPKSDPPQGLKLKFQPPQTMEVKVRQEIGLPGPTTECPMPSPL